MQDETLDTTVIDYINEIIARHEEEKACYEHQIHTLKNNVIEYENKYLEIKERYDLLIYRRFMRSAEQIPFDDKQQLLFTPEADPAEITAGEKDDTEKTEVRSYTRSKRGRKPIDSKITRKERIIDIPEEEKNCACGARLSRIGEEISEKLVIIEPQI